MKNPHCNVKCVTYFPAFIDDFHAGCFCLNILNNCMWERLFESLLKHGSSKIFTQNGDKIGRKFDMQGVL